MADELVLVGRARAARSSGDNSLATVRRNDAPSFVVSGLPWARNAHLGIQLGINVDDRHPAHGAWLGPDRGRDRRRGKQPAVGILLCRLCGG